LTYSALWRFLFDQLDTDPMATDDVSGAQYTAGQMEQERRAHRNTDEPGEV